LHYQNPKSDSYYRIKGTMVLKKSKSNNSFLDMVQRRAKSVVDPRKYSQIYDWTKNKGFMIPKDEKGGFIDVIQK